MAGLAAPIVLAAALILIAALALTVWLARRLAKARGWRSGATQLAMIGASLAGLFLGFVVVAATFDEAAWSPPPQLEISVTADYAHDWTIILEDPGAPSTLEWQGSSLPFAQRHARMILPTTGIARVRSLGEATGRGDLEVVWSDGMPSAGVGGGLAPAGSRAQTYLLIGRVRPDGSVPPSPPLEDLEDLIALREGRVAQ